MSHATDVCYGIGNGLPSIGELLAQDDALGGECVYGAPFLNEIVFLEFSVRETSLGKPGVFPCYGSYPLALVHLVANDAYGLRLAPFRRFAGFVPHPYLP